MTHFTGSIIMLYLGFLMITVQVSTVAAEGFDYEDLSIRHDSISSSSCLTTIDVRITEEQAKADLMIDTTYHNPRFLGAMMQVYYTMGPFGKAQWLMFPRNDIYVQPGTLLLPIPTWVENGMQTNGMWWVRVVLLVPKECPSERS